MRSWEAEEVELVLNDGDYVPDGNGGLRAAEGNEAVLQRMLWLLSVKRGSFPFLPRMGSRLYLLPREKPGNRLSAAKQYVEEALADQREVKVSAVELSEGDGDCLALTVRLDYRGEKMSGTVTVQ